MQDRTSPKRHLPRLRPRAAILVAGLLQGLSVTDAGAAAGLSQSAAKRLRRDPSVELALKIELENMVEQARFNLLSKTSEASACLLAIVADQNSPIAVRRVAADSILSQSVSLIRTLDRQELVELREHVLSLRSEVDALLANRQPSRPFAPPKLEEKDDAVSE